MKFKIQAGADIEVATRDEVRDEVRAGLGAARAAWMDDVARGDRFVRFAVAADIAAGQLSLGTLDNEHVGPQQGFVWSVKRLAVRGYDPATDALHLYQGEASDSSLVIPYIGRSTLIPDNGIVLYPGDRLILAGAVAGPGRVWLTGQARELPLPLAWRL